MLGIYTRKSAYGVIPKQHIEYLNDYLLFLMHNLTCVCEVFILFL